MPEINLTAEIGRPTGSGSARRLRAAGKVPGVVYGHGMQPVAIAVDHRELRHALSGPAGVNAVLNLSVDGKAQPTVVKALQRDPLKRVVSHVDFLVVKMDEAITIEVPIVLEGEAKAVLAEGGIVEHQMVALTVTTTPANIPEHFTIDVTNLQPGESIRVSELTLPSGVTTDVDPDTVVVLAATTRAEIEEEEAAEGEAAEGEEGEGGSAEGGAAASAEAGTE
jgi:large subunit ribosomal protein L25